MSHIVTILTEVRDQAAVEAACHRLKLPVPTHRIVQLFSGSATGLAVELPDWRYPLVCDLPKGELHYDNFNERWGEKRHLDSFLQAYAIERTRIECHRQGYTITEQPLEDGSVKLSVNVGGTL